MITGRAVNPFSFFADPDPAVFLTAGPDPAAFLMRIRIKLEELAEVENQNRLLKSKIKSGACSNLI